MVEYNKINVKLLNLQLSKLKTAVKNNEGTGLRIGAKNFNKQELPHELLLTQKQTTKLRNNVENNISTDMKLSKAQIKKIVQSGGFLGRLLGPLLKIATPLVTKALPILGLSAASSAIDAGIQKKILGSGTTTLIISNNELNDIIRIVQALEDHDILLKGITRTVKNETKQQKGGFLGMLMGTLHLCLVMPCLACKGS